MAPKSSIPFEASSKKSKKRQAKSHVLSTRHPAGWLAGVSAFSNVNIYKENEKPAFETPIFTRKTELLILKHQFLQGFTKKTPL